MIRLYKEYSIGVKKLSDADLGWESSSSSQTHIGLSEQVLKYLPNTPEQRDGILIYNRSCSFVECAFSKIGNKRSTKVDSTTSTQVKSVVRQIRNIASDSKIEWILVWFALDNQLPVFWLINSLSDDYQTIKDITGLDFQMKVFKASMDEFFKILSLIRTIVKLDNIVSQKYENDKDNILLAVSNEHRTFVHLTLDYFRAKELLDEMYPYFSTTENNMPIKVFKTGRFNLLNMFMFASTDEINRRNSTNKGRRWYSDVFSIKGRDCYLYVDWYPAKNKNGEDEQLMIPDFVNLVHDCYGSQYVYRNSQGTHELWLVNSPDTFGMEKIKTNLTPLSLYKQDLPSFWDNEKYKWEAVQKFQEKWDIEAEDFGAMIKEATSKHVNLLASMNYFPVGMIQSFASVDQERTRNMFRMLYDEDKDLAQRITDFMSEAEAFRKTNESEWRNHYQDLRAISAYLTFRYPEKYYIYKYTELKKTVEILGDTFSFKGKGDNGTFYASCIEYLNSLCERLASDEELLSMMHERLNNESSCYNDTARHITTTDFYFYVGKRLDVKRLNPDVLDSNADTENDLMEVSPNATPSIWVYAPGEGARKWQECLDENVMLLGWDDMENFRDYETRQDIVERLREVYGNTENAYTNDSLAIWQFCREMRPGDIVYVKRGLTLIVGRGIVKGGYTYNGERYEYKNSRAVEWTHFGEWEYPKKLPMKTLTRINDYEEMVERLESLFDPQVKVEQIPFSMTSLVENVNKTGLLYEDKLIQRYVCSLMTKPFVILSGLAGSGKTQLAIAFARAMSENVDQQLCVVPVGADWTNREPLLGYPNALKQGEYMQPESGVLQIMMRALRNPNKPYFLVLDEMNLSYVERYFADFLSALESKQEIPLWEKPDECDSEVPAKIPLPKNLFVIGTINVDETTYMFSPKVLDRANVIEFKITDDEMERFLKQDMDINISGADGLCANMGLDFVEKSTNKNIESSDLAQKTLIDFFKVLKKVNAEFGYRSATEIYRFIANAKVCAEGMTDEEILDAAIVQKLLPKLHGSRKKLEPALKALWGLCMKENHTTEAIIRENLQHAKFPEAADKIQRMMQTALENGFTSFAEA